MEAPSRRNTLAFVRILSRISILWLIAHRLSDANYLLKCVQGFNSEGITPYAISIQVSDSDQCAETLAEHYSAMCFKNEPQNSNPTYPSALITVSQEAQIGTALRTLLNNNGFSGVRIIGYEHNWDDASAYPVQLVSIGSHMFVSIADLKMSVDATSWRCLCRCCFPLLCRQCERSG